MAPETAEQRPDFFAQSAVFLRRGLSTLFSERLMQKLDTLGDESLDDAAERTNALSREIAAITGSFLPDERAQLEEKIGERLESFLSAAALSYRDFRAGTLPWQPVSGETVHDDAEEVRAMHKNLILIHQKAAAVQQHDYGDLKPEHEKIFRRLLDAHADVYDQLDRITRTVFDKPLVTSPLGGERYWGAEDHADIKAAFRERGLSPEEIADIERAHMLCDDLYADRQGNYPRDAMRQFMLRWSALTDQGFKEADFAKYAERLSVIAERLSVPHGHASTETPSS